jgi:eukaryotic-like serine/threonine-protein kinase
MTPERWRQVTEVFHVARGRDAAARAAFLDETCANDSELRAEVDAMLVADRDAGRFGESSIAAIDGARPASASGTNGLERLTTVLADRYHIEGELGAGGMATVYRAFDLRHSRQVAIKVLRPELAASLGPDRFLREIEIAAKLNHPHVLPLYDSGESSGFLYFVMPYVEGESLRERLAREGALTPAEATRILREILDALAHAHDRGIVHRDIKPDNIMLSGRHALVADFGIAKAVSQATTEATVTQTGLVVGTPAYMAPEQAAGDSQVDHRADIYAVGAVAYELLAGRPPFIGATAREVLSAHIVRTPEPLHAHHADVSRALANVVMKCLEKRPGDRWQSADEVLRELDMLAPGGSPTPTDARPFAAAASRGRWFVLPAVLAAVLGLGGATWLIVNGASTANQTAVEEPQGTRIAVLPFENLSGADGEAFVDGIARDLNTHLSKIGRFVVVGHSSAQRVSRAGVSHAQIARELAVKYLVKGSVSRAADRMRVTVSLIDPATSGQLWAEEYDHEVTLANIFSARRDAALSVAKTLNVALSADERVTLATQPTSSLEAYKEYQLGRFSWAKRTTAELQSALRHFERAIALDPSYALAHAGLADTHVNVPFYSSSEPFAAWLARGEAAANQALKLDPSLGQAHATLALVREFEFKWDTAEDHFRRAIQLDPAYATAHHWYADMLARSRRFEEAFQQIRTALDLDPLSTIVNADFAWIFGLAGQPEDAVRQYERTIELDPTFSLTWIRLAVVLLEYGRFEEGAKALSRWTELTGNDSFAVRQFVNAAAAHARSGYPQPLPAGLDLERTSPPFMLANLYMLLGHREQALAVLERGYERGAFSTAAGVLSPSFAALGTEPRFLDLVKKIGLEP